VKDLQKADTELATKVAEIEVLVAGAYVKRTELDAHMNAIMATHKCIYICPSIMPTRECICI
jgi:hypothetical protein